MHEVVRSAAILRIHRRPLQSGCRSRGSSRAIFLALEGGREGRWNSRFTAVDDGFVDSRDGRTNLARVLAPHMPLSMSRGGKLRSVFGDEKKRDSGVNEGPRRRDPATRRRPLPFPRDTRACSVRARGRANKADVAPACAVCTSSTSRGAR